MNAPTDSSASIRTDGEAPASPGASASATDAYGYIDPHTLEELWFHTGTACNLACPFCLEGSRPGDNRLNRVRLADVRPFIDEAVEIGVRQFSFTGGEPFIIKDFVNILNYASSLRPCLVLTNGTAPVSKRIQQIEKLARNPQPISFRISIDYPEADRHDAGRGRGSYEEAWQGLSLLHDRGFRVSLARQADVDEDSAAIDGQFRHEFERRGLPSDTTIVKFPDFMAPGAHPSVPRVTENCMTTFQSETSRRAFMCAFSKMVVKIGGKMRVYACTLVDDDPDYDLGGSLRESMQSRIMMRHHRCYSCFAFGSSCSEISTTGEV